MKILVTILIFVIAVSGIALNLTTKSGKIYKEYEILRVTDEVITIAHENGSATVAITDLPDDVKSSIQKRIDAYNTRHVIKANPVTADTPAVPNAAPVAKAAAAVSQPEVSSKYSYRATNISEQQFDKLWDMFKGALYLDTTTGNLQEIKRPGSNPKVSNQVRIISQPEFKNYLDKGGLLYFWIKRPVEQIQDNNEYIKQEVEIAQIMDYKVALGIQQEDKNYSVKYSYRGMEISEKQFNKLWNMFNGAIYIDMATGNLQEIKRPGSNPKVSNQIRIMSPPEFKNYLDKGGLLYFWIKVEGNGEYMKQEVEIARIMDYHVTLGMQQETDPAKYIYRGTKISEEQFNKLWAMFKGAIYFDKTTGSLLEIKRPDSNLKISNRINTMSQPEFKKYMDDGGVLYFWIKVEGNGEYMKQEVEIARIMDYHVTLGIQQETDPAKYIYRGTKISEEQFNKLWAMFKGAIYFDKTTGSLLEIKRPGSNLKISNRINTMSQPEFKKYMDDGGVLYFWIRRPDNNEYIKQEIEIARIMDYKVTLGIQQENGPGKCIYRGTEISEQQFNKLWEMFKGAIYIDSRTGRLHEIKNPNSNPKISNQISILLQPEFKKYLDNGGMLYFWIKVQGHDEYMKQEIEIAQIMHYNVVLGVQQDNDSAKYSYRRTEISEQQFNKLWEMFKGALYFDKTTGHLQEIARPDSNLKISNQISAMSQPELKKYLDNGGLLYFWIKVQGHDEYMKQEIEIAQIMNYDVVLGIQQGNEPVKYSYRGTEISEKQFNKLWDMFKGILYKQRGSNHRRDNDVSFAEITCPGEIPDYNTTELMTQEEFKIYLDQGGVLYRWFKKPPTLANPNLSSKSPERKHNEENEYVKKEIEISQIMNYPVQQLSL